MFVYCGNNPINAVDYSGHDEVCWVWWLDGSGAYDDDGASLVIAYALDGVGTGGTSSTTTYNNYYSTSCTSTATSSYYNSSFYSYSDPYYYSANGYSITTTIPQAGGYCSNPVAAPSGMNSCGQTGSYEILFESGKNYVGKGSEQRMIVSAKNHSVAFNDPVVSMKWEPANSPKEAFVAEYFKMAVRGVNNSNTYNLIWSPGRRYFIESLIQ